MAPTQSSGRHVAVSVKHFLGDGGTAGGRDQGDAQSCRSRTARSPRPGLSAGHQGRRPDRDGLFSSWHGAKTTPTRPADRRAQGTAWASRASWSATGTHTVRCRAAPSGKLRGGVTTPGLRHVYGAGQLEAGCTRTPSRRCAPGEIPAGRAERCGAPHFAGEDQGRPVPAAAPKQRWTPAGSTQLGHADAPRAGARGGAGVAGAAEEQRVISAAPRLIAKVLVAGEAAPTTIGVARPAAGLDWQGDRQQQRRLPRMASRSGGVQAAVAAGGGTAELQLDGTVHHKPDVAIVVFGENPYAEFRAISPPWNISPGDDRRPGFAPAIARPRAYRSSRCFCQGGRSGPTREINASDAFVAAWLPGTEGGGVADVLSGARTGAPAMTSEAGSPIPGRGGQSRGH